MMTDIEKNLKVGIGSLIFNKVTESFLSTIKYCNEAPNSYYSTQTQLFPFKGVFYSDVIFSQLDKIEDAKNIELHDHYCHFVLYDDSDNIISLEDISCIPEYCSAIRDNFTDTENNIIPQLKLFLTLHNQTRKNTTIKTIKFVSYTMSNANTGYPFFSYEISTSIEILALSTLSVPITISINTGNNITLNTMLNNIIYSWSENSSESSKIAINNIISAQLIQKTLNLDYSMDDYPNLTLSPFSPLFDDDSFKDYLNSELSSPFGTTFFNGYYYMSMENDIVLYNNNYGLIVYNDNEENINDKFELKYFEKECDGFNLIITGLLKNKSDTNVNIKSISMCSTISGTTGGQDPQAYTQLINLDNQILSEIKEIIPNSQFLFQYQFNLNTISIESNIES